LFLNRTIDESQAVVPLFSRRKEEYGKASEWVVVFPQEMSQELLQKYSRRNQE